MVSTYIRQKVENAMKILKYLWIFHDVYEMRKKCQNLETHIHSMECQIDNLSKDNVNFKQGYIAPNISHGYDIDRVIDSERLLSTTKVNLDRIYAMNGRIGYEKHPEYRPARPLVSEKIPVN